MDIQFYGANCVRITGKKASIIIDDNLAELGSSSVTNKDDVALNTSVHEHKNNKAGTLIDDPGEYEISNISIRGTAVRGHMDEDDQKSVTVYRVIIQGLRVVVTGHIHPDLSDDDLESIGVADILIVPVGGHGYTLDPVGALKVIKKIDPKMVVPTHYADSTLKYEVPQLSYDEAMKEMSLEQSDPVDKLKIKTQSDVGDLLHITKINKQ